MSEIVLDQKRIASHSGSGKKIPVLYVSLYVLLLFIISKIIAYSLNFDVHLKYWIQIISYISLGAAGIYLFRDMYRSSFIEWKERPVKNVLFLIGGYIADALLCSVAALPYATLYPDYTSVNNNNIDVMLPYVPAGIIIVSLGIFGPITEETIFRVILTEKGRKAIPTAVCIIVSSLLFMFIHVHALTFPDILSNLPMFATGLVYAVCMVKTKNITIPVILHIFNNTTILMMLLMNKG